MEKEKTDTTGAQEAEEKENIVVCGVCPHRCTLKEGQVGRCLARVNMEGSIRSRNYGVLTGIALDPVEKKPLYRFHPGSVILSVGSYGCNLDCPFCQNYEISRSDGLFEGSPDRQGSRRLQFREFTPRELLEVVKRAAEEDGNIGIAYTYNEPLVGYEFVLDTAKLVHEAGLLNVLVTNGCVNPAVLEELLPLIDAMNIDLKCFTDDGYTFLGGDLDTVKAFIKRSAADCHIELTTLIVPGFNDNPEDMKREAAWIASIRPDIPLHITRYFPRYRYREPATSIPLMRELKAITEERLGHVFLGNVV